MFVRLLSLLWEVRLLRTYHAVALERWVRLKKRRERERERRGGSVGNYLVGVCLVYFCYGFLVRSRVGLLLAWLSEQVLQASERAVGVGRWHISLPAR